MSLQFLCAIDSFKGCLNSRQAADSVKQGIQAAIPDAQVTTVAVADGGEGTVDALIYETNGEFVDTTVEGPLGDQISARYGILPSGEAVIEMAAASGITLISEDRRNPERTSTFGLGQLIRHALQQGVRDFLIGIGGSATNDAGTGMLQALGWKFLDRSGAVIQERGGQILSRIADYSNSQADPRLKKCRFSVACDVDNPFFGPQGAAFVYAPQKGADSKMVKRLDDGLKNLAAVIHAKQGLDVGTLPGAGAAGGLGGGFVAFLNAQLQSGIDLVLQAQNFDELILNADWIITGEGKIDAQTVSGKVVSGVARHAQAYHVPVIALGGAVLEREALNRAGITAAFAIQPGPISLLKAMNPETATDNLRQTAEQIARLLRVKQ